MVYACIITDNEMIGQCESVSLSMSPIQMTETLLHTHTHFYTHFLRTEAFTHRNFTQRSLYTEELLHTETFTHRSFYTQMLLTHRRVYTQVRLHTNTQNLLHTEAFPQRSLYTQKPLRTVAFAEKSFTQRRRSFYTEKDLHREAFTQAFTQGSFLHREAFPQSNSRIHTHTEAFTNRSFA